MTRIPVVATDDGVVERVASEKAFAGEHCPICGRDGPHNHSALVVEAFHRANENEARNFGLVTFSSEEIRSLTRRRATGINDRSEPRL
jgi:hypothetical protein